MERESLTNLIGFTNQIPDGGPVYQETDLHHLIVEPWNAISSLAFLIPVIYWLIRLKGSYKAHPFLVYCMPLLFLGGAGSTLYHAFRNSSLLLLMDLLPIFILTLSVGIYLWYKILPKRWYVILVILAFIGLRFPVFLFMEGKVAINTSYVITGVMMFLPLLIFLVRTRMFGLKLLILTVLFFALALFFREIDSTSLSFLPTGTHWLWHIFCSSGVFPLAEFLYRISGMEVSGSSLQKTTT